MPKYIYNEGRVVGYSAYELYVKHALEENPDIEPATEREWLAAQIGNGTSMILKVPVDTNSTVHTVEFPLPEDSDLCAANTIIASWFYGECEVDENGWATKVTDYGQIISNTEEKHPVDNDKIDANNTPTSDIYEYNDDQKKQFLQYMKIQDGLVLQPGTWMETDHGNPEMDLTPNLHVPPTIRITFVSKVSCPFYIMFTSFTDRSIVSGIAGVDVGSTSEFHPEDGDFLGPEIYPWANKIIFTYPPIASYYYRKYTIIAPKPNETASDKLIPEQNQRIDYDEDSIYTIFNASYLKPDLGINIDGPRTKAGDIIIGSIIDKDPNNYIKIDQWTSTIKGEAVNRLTHSHLTAGPGISYHSPTSPAEEIVISSIIESQNNFLKVEQRNHSSSSASGQDTTTFLTASRIVSNSGGIRVDAPATPGADTRLVVNITGSSPISVSSSNGNTRISISLDPDGGITTGPGGGLSLDLNGIANFLLNNDTFMNGVLDGPWRAIAEILFKMGSGKASLATNWNDCSGSGNDTVSIPSSLKDITGINWRTEPVFMEMFTPGSPGDGPMIPFGTMNIDWYPMGQQDTGPSASWIHCHQDGQDMPGDVRFRA